MSLQPKPTKQKNGIFFFFYILINLFILMQEHNAVKCDLVMTKAPLISMCLFIY